MFFAPSPYVDVTGLWSVPNRWSRILVSASGMLFEITLAAIAIILACTVDNSSIRYLCFSIATLGTFTTIAFNGNPLMRYDGYYILVDLIDRPNLLAGCQPVDGKPIFRLGYSKDTEDHFWSVPLLIYGICCWISRFLLMSAMGWGMWMTWDGAGLLVIAFFACLWINHSSCKAMEVRSQAGGVFLRCEPCSLRRLSPKSIAMPRGRDRSLDARFPAISATNLLACHY